MSFGMKINESNRLPMDLQISVQCIELCRFDPIPLRISADLQKENSSFKSDDEVNFYING